MKKLFSIFYIFFVSIASFSQVWNDDFNGIDSIWNESAPGGVNPITINCLYNDNDSIVYLGGGFAYTNSAFASCFASWDTDTINTYQQGVEWGGVNAIIKYKDTLYIGGSFHSASENPNTANLAIWNGSNWRSTSIGEVNAYVYDFCIYHDTLFIAGNFEDIGELECKKIVAYNGEDWINVGDMGMWTKALAVFNDELYAGGYWGVRKYLGGTEWETFNPRPNGYVNELMTDTINSFLFVGGQFSAINDEDSWGCAMWDGFKWNPMGTAYGSTVWPQASVMYRGEFYVGNGTRHHIEEDRWEFFIRKWNGESWDSIGGAFNSSILSLEVFRDTLYIGGNFGFWGGNSLMPDKRTKGMVKLFMPDNGCEFLKPRINTYADTFYLNNGEAIVNLYNNNPYADSWEWDFGTSTGSVMSTQAVEHIYTAVGEYNVQVTVTQGGCVKSANRTIYIEEGSGIGNYESIDMQVFPNPSSHNFTVKLELPDYKNAEIKIAGLNGHLKDIIPVTSETTIIPTKGWSAGTYICNLFIEEKLIKTEKLVFE
jgi:hypothetical protein